jgi:FixJ family two-component response regulator
MVDLLEKKKNESYLIDDDESIRRALQKLLRSDGFDVKIFSSAEEFMERGNLRQRGCILLDVRMPGLIGFDLQGKLVFKGIRLPVIAVSAFDDSKTRESARGLGATAFFRKSVDGQALPC